MSYVTDDWELEEVVLDFCEIVGEHSGDNLADTVWQTIELFGLQHKVAISSLLKYPAFLTKCGTGDLYHFRQCI